MRKFVKDGHEVTTDSPTEAVIHLARGYREVTDGKPGGSWTPEVKRHEVTPPQPKPPKPDYPKSD